jgi:uncharacterized protein (TIRG00374 family)
MPVLQNTPIEGDTINDKTKHRLSLAVSIVAGIGLFAALLAAVDLRAVGAALANARYIYLPAGLLLFSIGHFPRAVRWRLLLSKRLPFWRVFHILNISGFFNGVLPFRLGEVARMFLTMRGKDPVPLPTSLTTIVIERLLDMLFVSGLLGLGLTFAPVPESVVRAGVAAFALTIIALLLLILAPHREAWLLRLAGWIEERMAFTRRFNIKKALVRVLDGARLLSKPGKLLSVLAWTLVAWAMSIGGSFILLYVFFDQPPLFAAMLVVVLASFSFAVPLVPGAAGAYEASVILALTITGLIEPAGSAAAYALVLHGVILLDYAILGTIGLLVEGISVREITAGARQIKTD